MNYLLSIKNFSVTIEDTPILHAITLELEKGRFYALMGPNGSGKSTFALTLMGHPAYTVTGGDALLNGESLLALPVHKRAQKGFFLSFQQPYEIPGVPISVFLKASYESVHGHITPQDLKEKVLTYFDLLHMDHALYYRNVHEGFSGGQKKKLELLQLLLLKPQIAVLDEIDSGLDVDALKIVAHAIEFAKKENPTMTVLMITHYRPLLDYVVPHAVFVMHKGQVVHTGNADLIQEIDQCGYERFCRDI
jgi:Fe-S cluster assembly ATP-binding protein